MGLFGPDKDKDKKAAPPAPTPQPKAKPVAPVRLWQPGDPEPYSSSTTKINLDTWSDGRWQKEGMPLRDAKAPSTQQVPQSGTPESNVNMSQAIPLLPADAPARAAARPVDQTPFQMPKNAIPVLDQNAPSTQRAPSNAESHVDTSKGIPVLPPHAPSTQRASVQDDRGTWETRWQKEGIPVKPSSPTVSNESDIDPRTLELFRVAFIQGQRKRIADILGQDLQSFMAVLGALSTFLRDKTELTAATLAEFTAVQEHHRADFEKLLRKITEKLGR